MADPRSLLAGCAAAADSQAPPIVILNQSWGFHNDGHAYNATFDEFWVSSPNGGSSGARTSPSMDSLGAGTVAVAMWLAGYVQRFLVAAVAAKLLQCWLLWWLCAFAVVKLGSDEWESAVGVVSVGCAVSVVGLGENLCCFRFFPQWYAFGCWFKFHSQGRWWFWCGQDYGPETQ